ncbi:LPS O-antigen chain length determinant protein WzzB [Vibrio sp. HN007]|uniref:LPS O-antigen chain length determinant protein WzzB n=1 Tax=Vibrio iocasae TaxID=3098914 RepID=UPI0035D5257B
MSKLALSKQEDQLQLHNHGGHSDDEIDLKEILITIWKGKWIVVFLAIIIGLCATVYSFTLQEWWSAKAKVVQPQLSDFEQYRNQVTKFQPIFDVYQADGTLLVSEELNDLIDPEVIYSTFLQQFNSSSNKISFFDDMGVFTKYESEHGKDLSEDELNNLYSVWRQKINSTITPVKEGGVASLSLQAEKKVESYFFLNKYIERVSNKTQKILLKNLEVAISSKKNALHQEKKALEFRAKSTLKIEVEKARYALKIAKSASLDSPSNNLVLNEKELFSINLGAKALASKIDVLGSISNLEIIEPSLVKVNAKIEALDKFSIKENVDFKPFGFLEDVSQPTSKDKPKRLVIIFLGVFLGVFLGMLFVIVQAALTEKNRIN